MNGIRTMLLIFGLITTLPGVAFAKKPSSSNYNLVYSEADFSSTASVQELHAKIVRTARSHCPSYFSTRSLADIRNCVRDVVTNLVRVINHPQLTAYAQGNEIIKLSANQEGSDAQS